MNFKVAERYTDIGFAITCDELQFHGIACIVENEEGKVIMLNSDFEEVSDSYNLDYEKFENWSIFKDLPVKEKLAENLSVLGAIDCLASNMSDINQYLTYDFDEFEAPPTVITVASSSNDFYIATNPAIKKAVLIANRDAFEYLTNKVEVLVIDYKTNTIGKLMDDKFFETFIAGHSKSWDVWRYCQRVSRRIDGDDLQHIFQDCGTQMYLSWKGEFNDDDDCE